MKLAPGSLRNRRSRLSAALVGTLALGLALSACGSGPSQVGAAAIVGDQRITLDDVQTRIDALYRQPDLINQLKQQGGDIPDASRYIVTGQVEHVLLMETAKLEGLTVDDAAVDKQIQTDGGVKKSAQGRLTDEGDGLRSAVRDELLLRALAAKYFGTLAVSYDTITVQSPEQARDLASKIAADPGHSRQLMQAVPGGKPDLGKVTGSAAADPNDPNAQLNDAITAVLNYAPANSVLMRSDDQGQQGGGYEVVYVRGATVAPGAKPIDLDSLVAAQQLDPSVPPTIGKYLLRPLAAELGVRISPRYGDWDPTLMKVVPATQAAAAGELLPAAAPAKS